MWLEDSGEISAVAQERWHENGGSDRVRIAVFGCKDVGLSRISMDPVRGEAMVGLDIFHRHRGKGLAKSVFHETCNEALARGANKLTLWVFWDNELAVRIYKAQNFAIDESEPVKWYVRQFPQETRPAPHAYIKMTREAQ